MFEMLKEMGVDEKKAKTMIMKMFFWIVVLSIASVLLVNLLLYVHR